MGQVLGQYISQVIAAEELANARCHWPWAGDPTKMGIRETCLSGKAYHSAASAKSTVVKRDRALTQISSLRGLTRWVRMDCDRCRDRAGRMPGQRHLHGAFDEGRCRLGLSWISTFKHRRSRKLWQGRTAPVLQPDLILQLALGRSEEHLFVDRNKRSSTATDHRIPPR